MSNNFAISSTECVEAFYSADLNSLSVWTHGEITGSFVNFGKRLGVESLVDEIGNVIIRKAATRGYGKP